MTAMAMIFWPRTARSPPGEPWRPSPPAKDADRRRSCRQHQPRPSPTRYGTATEAMASRTAPRARLDRCRALGRHPRESRNRPRPFPISSLRSCAGWSAGRPRVPLGCMRSSSTATACSCGSRLARLRSKPAKDSTGPRNLRRSRKRRRLSAIASSMARSSPTTITARPISPRCRPPCPRRKPTISCSTPSICCSRATSICAHCHCPNARPGCSGF